MLAIILLPAKGWCTKISGGTTLYLDVSAIWSNGTSFSAEFEQEGNYNTATVPMSKVSNEAFVWRVTAPDGTWDYIIFHCTAPSPNKRSYTIEWCGTYPLFYITAENGQGPKGSEGGMWLNYLPIPDGMPSNVNTIVVSDVCVEETNTLQLEPFTDNEFVNLQWFECHNESWSRIVTRDARTTVVLPDLKNDTVYYYFEGVRLLNNLVPNPNFEQGNTGFITDYTYVSPTNDALFPTGLYTITDDIGKVHSMHPVGGYDHTYGDGSGHCMAFNGGNDYSKRVWSVNIDNVKPNTTYVFSAWVMAWADGNLAQLQFSVNGEVLGGVFSPSGGEYVWTQLYTYWHSGNATNATITLLNFQTAGGGNDFAIDDISFGEVEEYSCLHKVCVKHCNECSVVLSKVEQMNIDCENGTYDLQGEIRFDNSKGDISITVDNIHSITYANPISPLQFLFEDLPVDYESEKPHSISVVFSGDNACLDYRNFTVPVCQRPCPVPIDSIENINICDTLLPFLWHEKELTNDGIYYDTLRNAQKCDSILFQLRFSTETCTPEEPPIEPITCIPGLIYAKWANVLFCDNSSGKYIGYQWYNNDVTLEGQTKQYLYIPEGLFGTFAVKLTLANGTTEWACPIDYSDIPRSADIPNDTPNRVRICDANGRVIFTGSETDILSIKAGLPHGIYIVFIQANDKIQVNKWIL